MESNDSQQRKNIQALASGMLLIVFVGVFFIAKSLRTPSNPDGMIAFDDQNTPTTKKTLSASELQRKMVIQDKILMADVRSADDYNKKHIPKSRSYPRENIANVNLEKDTLLVIIASKNDTLTEETVTNILKEKGIDYIFLADGFEEWDSKGYPVISEGDPRDFVDQSKVTYITADRLAPLLTSANNFYLIDVQKPENYNKKHIDGAINIPLAELEKRANEIPSGKQIIVYGANELESFRGGTRLFDLNTYSVQTLRGNNHLRADTPFTLRP